MNNSNCHVVPWYNSEEWHKLYQEISDSSINKENAVNTLLIWKARCPSLPSGIESTLSLLQVHVEDSKQVHDDTNDQLLRLAYSTAIMRFVNHMLDTETVKGTSLYQAAKTLGVPDWLVDLRHDTAHSNNLPQISLLREACTISLQWLQQNYWDKYKPNIRDYVSGQKNVYQRDVDKISTLINLYTSLSMCAHPNCKIKNLAAIPEVNMRDSIVNDVNYLFGDHVDLSNLKSVSITSLFNIINKHNKNLLNIPDLSKHVNEAILSDDSLFLSKELIYFFSANEFKHRNKLNNNYIQCFKALLTFLHTNDLIFDFLLALINITQNSEGQHFKARLAALWVSEILLALKRCREFSKKLESMMNKNQPSKKKDFEKLYHQQFPSTKENNLLLDLHKNGPKELWDIKYIQPIVTAYNPYLIYFIRNLLDLLDPSLPSSVAEKVYKLAELISSPEKYSKSCSSSIYTVEDLKVINKDHDDDIEITAVIHPESEDMDVQEPDCGKEHIVDLGIWKLASKTHNWSSCPIGQLPWQQEVEMETDHV